MEEGGEPTEPDLDSLKQQEITFSESKVLSQYRGMSASPRRKRAAATIIQFVSRKQ